MKGDACFAAKVSKYVAGPVELRPSLVLFLLLISITFPILFLGVTATGVTLMGPLPEGSYGYKEYRPPEAYTRDAIGSVAGDMADEVYTRDVLKDGALPLWNPYQGQGWQFLSDPSSKVFYLPNFARLIIPTAYWDLIGVAHIFLIGFFVFLFAIASGLPRFAAIVAGACAFSIGHLQINIGASSIIQTETWIPLVFYAVETAIGGRRRSYNWLVAAVATYGAATGGHPGPAIYGAIAVSLYTLVRVCQRGADWRALLGLLPPMMAGVFLGTPTWLNFLDSVRTDVTLAHMSYPLVPSILDLPAFFMPYLFGNINTPLPSTADNWGIGYVPPAVTFLAFAAAGRNLSGVKYPQLTALMITSICLLLWGFDAPGLSIVRQIPFLSRMNPNYLWIIPSFALCFAAGIGVSRLADADRPYWRNLVLLWSLFVFVVLLLFAYAISGPSNPLYSSLFSPVVFRGLAAGVGWMMVMPAITYAIQRCVPRHGVPSATLAVALAAVVLSSVGYFPSGNSDGGVLSAALALGAILVVSTGIVLMARGGWTLTTWRLVAASTVPAIAASWVAAISIPGLPKRYDPFTPPPFVGWLREHTQEDGARVYATTGILFPNFASAYRISSINILSTSTPAWNSEFVRAYLDPAQSPSMFTAFVQRPWEEVLKRRRFWSYVGVKYVLGRDFPVQSATLGQGRNYGTLQLVHLDVKTAVEVWQNDLAEPRLYVAPAWIEVDNWRNAQRGFGAQSDLRRIAFVEKGAHSSCVSNQDANISATVSNLKVNPNTVSATIETDRGGVLILVDLWVPGWSAVVNGVEQKSFRVNGVFRGVCLAGAGRHQVVFRFEPPLLRLSLLLSGVSVLFLVAVGWRRHVRRPIRADQSSRPG